MCQLQLSLRPSLGRRDRDAGHLPGGDSGWCCQASVMRCWPVAPHTPCFPVPPPLLAPAGADSPVQPPTPVRAAAPPDLPGSRERHRSTGRPRAVRPGDLPLRPEQRAPGLFSCQTAGHRHSGEGEGEARMAPRRSASEAAWTPPTRSPPGGAPVAGQQSGRMVELRNAL